MRWVANSYFKAKALFDSRLTKLMLNIHYVPMQFKFVRIFTFLFPSGTLPCAEYLPFIIGSYWIILYLWKVKNIASIFASWLPESQIFTCSNAENVTSNRYSQGIRFLSKVTGKSYHFLAHLFCKLFVSKPLP